jgi:hypothetical protein
MGESPKPPADNRSLWAVVLEIREDGRATRRHIEGWIAPDGTHHEGLTTKHNQLRADVDELIAAKGKGGERRWLLAAGGIGAAIAKGIDLFFAYITTKGGNHP